MPGMANKPTVQALSYWIKDPSSAGRTCRVLGRRSFRDCFLLFLLDAILFPMVTELNDRIKLC